MTDVKVLIKDVSIFKLIEKWHFFLAPKMGGGKVCGEPDELDLYLKGDFNGYNSYSFETGLKTFDDNQSVKKVGKVEINVLSE